MTENSASPSGATTSPVAGLRVIRLTLAATSAWLLYKWEQKFQRLTEEEDRTGKPRELSVSEELAKWYRHRTMRVVKSVTGTELTDEFAILERRSCRSCFAASRLSRPYQKPGARR